MLLIVIGQRFVTGIPSVPVKSCLEVRPIHLGFSYSYANIRLSPTLHTHTARKGSKIEIKVVINFGSNDLNYLYVLKLYAERSSSRVK